MVYDYTIDISNDNTTHSKILKMIDRDKNVLEIGCATGYMTRYLKTELNCRVYGLEIDPEAATLARPFCQEIVIGDIETLDLTRIFTIRRFDVIVMADVLEHLKDAGKLLARLTRLLAPNGCIILSLPNGAHGSIGLEILDGRWQYRQQGLLDATHLHFFDKDSITILLDEAGFYISRLQRIIIHPRDTEMKTPWDSYPRDVTAYLEKVNPEFQTYQFVIKACLTDEKGGRAGLEDARRAEEERADRLEQEMQDNLKELTSLKAMLAEGHESEYMKMAKEYRENLRNEQLRLEREIAETHKGYQKHLAHQSEELKNAQLDAVHFRRRTGKLTQEQNQAQQTIAQLQANNEQLQTNNTHLEKANTQYLEAITLYQTHTGNLEKQADEFRETVQSLEFKAALLRDEIAQLREEIISLNQANQDAWAINNDLQAQNTSLSARLMEIEQSLIWRIATRYRRILNTLLPEGSLRRRIYHRSLRAVTQPFLRVSLASPPSQAVPSAPVSELPEVTPPNPPEPLPLTPPELIAPATPEEPTPTETTLPEEEEQIPETQVPEEAPAATEEPPTVTEEPPAPEIPPWRPLQFPAFQEIEVSIVIPVFNKGIMTFNCLESIMEHSSIPYEVILVDNASDQETSEILGAMTGIRLIRNQKNKGFVEACNQGAEAASGKNILFLNNDTLVTADWLAAMVAPLVDEKVGLVGAKLVFPDGRLQEAGGIIWQDGTGWNYGREDDPSLPQYNYLKEVDYCSGACLLIRRELWLELGGFDLRYAPAYYEDTDLCFAARAKGYKVVYQPEAEIIHLEGASAGTDITKGYKRFQQINHEKFFQKWREVLKADHFTGPEALYLARERGKQHRVVVMDHYAPTFDKDSGSLRMLTLLNILNKLNYKIVFWPHNLIYHDRYSRNLQRMGIETMYGPMDFDAYSQLHGLNIDIIILSRPHVAIDFIYAAKRFTEARVIYDTVDLHFLREERREEIEGIPASQAVKDMELFLINQADDVLVVSDVEKGVLEKMGFVDKVSLISNIHSVEKIDRPFSQRQGLMFIGGFDHTPNEDGIVWFVREILPLIRDKLPRIPLTIVGSNPTEKVLALTGEQITVTGYVEDVRPFFAEARIFVCPLRYGAGVKGKIGQSMAFGLPVVMTSVGAEGLGVTNDREALIADSAQGFADKVVALYRDPERWEKLSLGGMALIEKRFSPRVVQNALIALIDKGNK
ncbi:MAG: glycosyltransferase [Proteobacteria bacterium]|nr:glycosyltransferase [Pseudomonadota bacterium]MBU1686231.1 glycosyltransferase [Pseudomonadota bacterium]